MDHQTSCLCGHISMCFFCLLATNCYLKRWKYESQHCWQLIDVNNYINRKYSFFLYFYLHFGTLLQNVTISNITWKLAFETEIKFLKNICLYSPWIFSVWMGPGFWWHGTPGIIWTVVRIRINPGISQPTGQVNISYCVILILMLFEVSVRNWFAHILWPAQNMLLSKINTVLLLTSVGH